MWTHRGTDKTVQLIKTNLWWLSDHALVRGRVGLHTVGADQKGTTNCLLRTRKRVRTCLKSGLTVDLHWIATQSTLIVQTCTFVIQVLWTSLTRQVRARHCRQETWEHSFKPQNSFYAWKWIGQSRRFQIYDPFWHHHRGRISHTGGPDPTFCWLWTQGQQRWSVDAACLCSNALGMSLKTSTRTISRDCCQPLK